MSNKDILTLIKDDPWMMDVLSRAEKLNLPDWIIGAGFVRNKVWNHLHGYTDQNINRTDVDLVYFDPKGNDYEADKKLAQKLKAETGIDWEIVNQQYAHTWNNLPPYKSTEDALSQWPETVTAIGVILRNGELQLIAPHGVEDLVNLIVRPTPMFLDRADFIKGRVAKKQWLQKWPKLKLMTFS